MGENVSKSQDEAKRTEVAYTHEDPVVDAALDWFLLLREAEGDAEVLARFRGWLTEKPQHEDEFRAVEEMWGSAGFLKAVRSLPEDITEKFIGEGARQNIRVGRRKWALGMAAAASICVLAVGLWQGPRLMLDWQADYLTVAGEQSTIRLPDGSTLVLNTDSAVTIDFEDGHRNIALLRGEAWFDVEHDPDHPFKVTGQFGQAVVKGTAFSVRREGQRDEVVLERGRVDVRCLCLGGDRVELEPGESVDVTKSGPQGIELIDTEQRLAWRQGRLVFEDQPLGHVIDELARYYGGKIILSRGASARLLVSGNYRLNDIEAAVRTLADVSGVGMVRLPGGIIILR
ncbi:FecR family protein [Celeribacter sp. ULVN23_4]